MSTQGLDPLQEDAAAWVARMDSGRWSSLDEADLQFWLDGDALRPGALLQMQASWMALDEALAERIAEPRRPIFGRRSVLAGGGALAASLAGGLIWANSARIYRTERGEIRRVPLEDGSVAEINTMSRIEVSLRDARRDVSIEQGEAWFQVAKDAKRPFLVAAGRIRAQAIGTAFSVRRRDNGADVIVTEGIVDVWAGGAEGAKKRLVAGEGAFIGNNAGIKRLAGTAEGVENTLAWRAGQINLVGDSLSVAAAEFNRYNERQLVIVDPAIAGQLFDGVFRIDNPEGFALAIRDSLKVKVDISSKSQIIIGAAATR